MATLTVSIDGTEYDLEYLGSWDSLLEAVNEQRLEDHSNSEDSDKELDMWEQGDVLKNIDWEDSGIHEKYQNNNVFDYVEAYLSMQRRYGRKSDFEEILDAAIECNVDIYYPSRIPDKYIGKYKSDEEYAQEYAETQDINLGIWPYTCIDWKQAAKEILSDINSHNNHYFYA